MANVLEFHEFCPQVLKLQLTPGQNVVAKIAFGSYEPKDLTGEEYELAIQMFGGAHDVSDSAKRYVCLRLGRGSGKTTLCAAYSVYKAVTHDISKVGPGDVPYVVTVAPDKPTAALSIRMAREMIRSQPALERLIMNDTDMMISLRRPDGRMVRIEAFAANKGGAAVRGRTIISFLLDEAEFFTSNVEGGARDYSVNDKDIFGALKFRLLRNGKGMLVSTPWPVETLMGQMFEENWGNPKTALAVKAPTILVRGNDPDIKQMVEDELTRDPENARRELFCELDHLSSGEFFDVSALTHSLDSLTEFPQPFNPKWPVAVGCDFGFTRDSSAIVVVQFDGKYYRTVYIEELRPTATQPLKPSRVIARFAEIAKRYEVTGVVADGYYREAVKEQLQDHNLIIIDAPDGAKGKVASFQRVRSLLNEGRIRIPDVTIGRRMVQQAKLVTSRATPGGTTTVRIPRKIGLGHGDIVSAWILAVQALAWAVVVKEKPMFVPGSTEWNENFRNKILAKEEKWEANTIKELEKSAMKEQRNRPKFINGRRI